MKIYLDNCSLQRPMDSKTQLRIIVEAEAVLGIVGLCESGQLALVDSEILHFEIQRSQNLVRKQFAFKILSKAVDYVEIGEEIESKSQVLIASGIKPVDALHLASAEESGVDYFCTCDDRFLKRAKSLDYLRVKVVSPTDLILEIDK